MNHKIWTKEKIEELVKEKKFKNIVEWYNYKQSSYVVFCNIKDKKWKEKFKNKYFPNIRVENHYFEKKENRDKLEIYLKNKKFNSIRCWEKENVNFYRLFLNSGKKEWIDYIKNKFFPERKQRLTTEYFIKKANKIHKNKYDYSKTICNGSYEKVIIVCKKHGEFEQLSGSHLRGTGCRKCWLEKNKKPKKNKG